MTDQENECRKCPEGQVLKDGRCVLPEVTFTAFVMSLNTAALYHFGELADPETGRTAKDLMLAKHTIDTLKLLQEKTAGNLTRDEENLLETVLYDLKLRYVKAVG
jgi:thymidylate synthase ThyX